LSPAEAYKKSIEASGQRAEVKGGKVGGRGKRRGLAEFPRKGLDKC
jgi:hypothetical protein